MCHKKVNILRIASFIVVFAVLFSALGGFNVLAAESGTCGENLKWSFSGGTLTISGKGEMKNYSEADKAPWYDFREEITAVVLPDKLESIGTLAFYNCTALKAIAIPEKVQKIADKAFYNCTSLRMVALPNGLKNIGRAAFYNCEKLESATLPEGLETISEKAFYLCRSIASVIIPQSVTSIGKEAFAYCESLLRVEIKAQIEAVPEWCFYGCSSLTQIKLPDTVTEIEFYAFKNCDSLYTVYCSSDGETAQNIRNQIAEDLPDFKTSGYVAAGDLSESTDLSQTETDQDGNFVSQTNTSVQTDEGVTLVAQVQNTTEEGQNNRYSVHLILTVESEDDWATAILAVRAKLSEINDRYSLTNELNSIKITLYLKSGNTVNKEFLRELAGRNVTLEVIDSSGSIWCVDCKELKIDDVKSDAALSYTVTEGSDKAKERLGTDNCYSVKFENSSNINTNVVISLPQTTANTNAFLYQVVGGKYNRIQASAVDSNGNARFYLSSINKNGKYVIGINVPSEKVEDVIIPDEADDPFGAIARLEKIEYVSAGTRTFAGFTIGQFTLILFGILLFIAIVVGISMYMIYKNKQQLEFLQNKFGGSSKTEKQTFKKRDKKK